MKEKINLQELASLLSEKAGISKKEAEIFLREFFSLAEEALINDKQLKIKDLGSFKVIGVEDRESINVRTGERVLIPAHRKISFSAATGLSEVINKPFALFEPAELEEGDSDYAEEQTFEEDNDDFVIDEKEEMPEVTVQSENNSEEERVSAELPVEVEPEETVASPEEEKNISPIAQTINIEKKVIKNNRIPAEESRPENEPVRERREESEIADSAEPNDPIIFDYDERNESSFPWKTLSFVFLFLLLVSIGFNVYLWNITPDNYALSLPANDPVPVYIPQEPEPEIPIINDVTDSVPEAGGEVEPVSSVPEPVKLDQQEKIYTVRSGERLTIIAEREYGNKFFWVYIYEENKDVIKNPNVLSPGIKLKIPAPSKYNIDKDNPESVRKAKNLTGKYE